LVCIVKDEQLLHIIEGCRNQDRTCQHLLYKSFYNYSMSVALRYLNAMEEAEEIVNDAFFKVFTKLEKFGGEMMFKSWLRRIIINTAIDKLRSKKSLPTFIELDFVPEEWTNDNEALYDISKNQIKELIKKLPDAYSKVFNMYVIDEMGHEEIAEVLNITVGTSKSNLSRARKIFKVILENEEFMS
jgi:RNA polymerase sigma factor (sigma-70 family)